MFQGEKLGLDAILATGSVRCPKAIAVVTVDENSPSAALVMENLEMGYSRGSSQAKLGEELARYVTINKINGYPTIPTNFILLKGKLFNCIWQNALTQSKVARGERT